MALSNDLISQFVKSTRDDTKTKSEATVYGTIRKYDSDDNDGSTIYVQLDNTDPDLLTPVKASSVYMDKTNVKEGERVMVLIKNHTATITGNLSSPAARDDEVKGISEKLDNLDASHISVERLEAVEAVIEDLDVTYATIQSLNATNVKINNLSATYATISSLEAVDGKIDNLSSTYATIKSLNAVDAKINTLSSTYATITSLDAVNARIDNLGATYATIKSLDAVDAKISNLGATYATITDLNAAKASIRVLSGDVSDINTLMFGSATGSTLQTSFANAVIAQLGNAQIKSAMIDTVSANKITSGDIITDNINVKSQNGKLIISDETIQISDSVRVRVQIGKDASNDYSINVWDEAGNLMFSEGGITDKAIKDAIIRNDMVSDTANIAAHKLDIDSLFDEINDSTNTIKSTKVYLDDKKQTLDIAFTSLSTTVTELQNGVSSQGTQISVIQGQITSKVWQQDITNATNELGEQTETLSTNYSELKQQVDGLSATVSSNSTAISKKADNTTVTNVTNRVSSLETGLSNFQSTVSSTYATKTNLTSVETKATNALNDINNLQLGGRNLAVSTSDEWTEITVTTWSGTLSHTVNGVKNFTHNYTDYGVNVGDYLTFGVDLNSTGKPIAIRVDQHKADGNGSKSNYGNYISVGKTGRSVVKIQMLEEYPILKVYVGSDGTVSTNTIEHYKCLKIEKGNRSTDWTPAIEDTNNAISDLESRVNTAETKISQTEEAIALTATKTEVSTAKSEAISSANSNTSNLLKSYSTTTEMNAAINTKADSITSTVSSTYATKTQLNTANSNVTALGTRVTNAESSITQLSNKVTTNVTETTNLGTRMTTVEQTASGLTTRLDSQTIGGTNILRSTNTVEDFVSSALWSNGTWRTAGSTTGARTVIDISDAPNGDITKGFSITGDGSDVTTCQDRVPITSGLTYTMSCYARGTGILRFQVGRSPYSYKTCTLNNVTTWTKYSYTFVAGDGNGITDGVTNVYFGNRGTDTIEICGLKMELGNVATDWTPSPYDTTSGIEAASKTATDYLGFSSGGLVVGDMTKNTLGNNVLIDTDSVDIRNNTTTLASFGADYLYLAKNSRNATIDMCNGLATMYHASKYSYDSLFVIDTAVVEMIGSSTPLCLTANTSLENVSIQFANSSKVLGGIGIIGSWLRRYGSNMFDTYTLLDSGNFHDVMDSGWVYCTYGDGFTRYSNSQANIQVRKIGKQVYLRGEAKPTTAVTPESETSTVLAVVPEGYRPSYRQNFVMQGSSAYRWLMSVYPGGNICISRYTNDTTMNKSISAGAWLCCYAQWTID